MISLSGALYLLLMRSPFGGLMLTPEMGNAPQLEGMTWAADNGCYSAQERFSVQRWLSFLKRWQGQGHCLFAVAPDVPFDMGETLTRSLPLLDTIRTLGYPAALAIQNGVERFNLPWDDFDAVFIAGDKPFKTSRIARAICEEAQTRDKHIHIARRNSARALQEAYGMGAHSCDGTFLKYGPDKNWLHLQRWFISLRAETQMELW
jgi:hypothetical protein